MVANGVEMLAIALSTVHRCAAFMHAHGHLKGWSTDLSVRGALVALHAPVGVVQALWSGSWRLKLGVRRGADPSAGCAARPGRSDRRVDQLQLVWGPLQGRLQFMLFLSILLTAPLLYHCGQW